MSFNPNVGRNEYTANASQTVFTFDFKIFEDTNILVYLTPLGQTPNDTTDILMLTTDYTVVISGDLGGTITLATGAAMGDSVTLRRVLPITRYIEFQNNGDLLASTLNLDQDYQAYLIADKETDNTRFLKLPDSAQNIDTLIPTPTPLNFFQWNAAGDAIVNVSTLTADGYVWTAGDVYNKTEIDALLVLEADQLTTYSKAEIDITKATTTHDFTTDADYTLTTAQNPYGRIVVTDTGIVLTTARNVITDNVQKSFIFQNNTLQSITVKTLAGSGILVIAGQYAELYNDGTNILNITASIGVNQTEASYVGSRLTGVTYTNTIGSPIFVKVSMSNTTNTNQQVTVNGVIGLYYLPAGTNGFVSFPVPVGGTYKVATSSGTPTIQSWIEVR